MRRIPLVLSLGLLPLAALAGPPFLTDDPEPVKYRSFEAILYGALDRASNERTLTGPGVDFNYGLEPGLQLNLEAGWVWQRDAAGEAVSGPGDLRAALKWRLTKESDARPEIAVYPAVILPTGRRTADLGNGRVSYQFPVWFEKNWGNWKSDGGMGYTLNRAPGKHNWFYGGWLLRRKLGGRWYLGGEIYAQARSEADAAGYTALNFGGGYAINKQASLIFSAGHSFAGANHLLAYLGVDFIWGV